MGFTGLALRGLMAEGKDQAAAASSPPKVDQVIWLFMMGGVSHIEGFDPKPALTRYGGKSIGSTPYRELLEGRRLDRQDFGPKLNFRTRILPLQTGYRKYGQNGVEISNWWPHVAGCIDDLTLIRSMWTTDAEHSAVLQFHTGRSMRVGREPSFGSWLHYGLGTLNQELPSYVVLGHPPSSFQGGFGSHQASYLGSEHEGVLLGVEPGGVLPYSPERIHNSREAQEREFAFIDRLNRRTVVEYPDDPALRARIKNYELAFRLQTSLPELVRCEAETQETRELYGFDNPVTRPFGEQCLMARRLAERGVRFIQLYHGGNPANDSGDWDSHENLREKHALQCSKVDKPIAGLLKDLKRRGMLERTLVVWATEFGRSPNIDIRTPCGPMDDTLRTGRDHHIYGFSVWLAGAGMKPGMVHGATDELGFHAIESPHYVTDLHATVLHLMGIDSSQLQIPGHKRLDMDRGKVIHEIIA